MKFIIYNASFSILYIFVFFFKALKVKEIIYRYWDQFFIKSTHYTVIQWNFCPRIKLTGKQLFVKGNQPVLIWNRVLFCKYLFYFFSYFQMTFKKALTARQNLRNSWLEMIHQSWLVPFFLIFCLFEKSDLLTQIVINFYLIIEIDWSPSTIWREILVNMCFPKYPKIWPPQKFWLL